MALLPIKRIIIGFGVLIVVCIVVIGLFLFVEPQSKVERLLISNISDTGASVSWVTASATKGAVRIVPDKQKFPLFELTADSHLDDRDAAGRREHFFTQHHVTLSDLAPNTTYTYRIYQGWRQVGEGRLRTGSSLSAPSAPNLVYGTVVKADKKTPQIGSLVYLRLHDEKQKKSSAVLSTVTNQQGRWSIDMSQLRTADGKKVFTYDADTVEQLIVSASQQKTVKANTKIGADKPWPVMIVKN